jgi:hypothetical protein
MMNRKLAYERVRAAKDCDRTIPRESYGGESVQREQSSDLNGRIGPWLHPARESKT